jgi:hypothetical protein
MQAKSEVIIKFSGDIPTATPAANKKVAACHSCYLYNK